MADRNPLPVLRQLAARPATQELVLGLGPGLVQGLGRSVDGLRPFPNLSGPGCEVPSTQADIWCWFRGNDQGEVMHAGFAGVHGGFYFHAGEIVLCQFGRIHAGDNNANNFAAIFDHAVGHCAH